MKRLHHPHPASAIYLRYVTREQRRRQKNKNDNEGYSMYEVHQNNYSAPPALSPQRSLFHRWQRLNRQP